MNGHTTNGGIWLNAPADFSKTIVSLSLMKSFAIRDMGFGPVQTIGCPKLDEDLCHMMLHNLEPLNQTVVIHGRSFSITPSDFERLMGIEDGGVDLDFSGGVSESMIAVLKKDLDGNDGNITLNSLRDIVMNRREVDDIFKVAFVMYAISGLLCPTEGDIVDHILIAPLMRAESIRGLNWATYCYSKLQDAVLTMKPEDTGRISVCYLFLQLFYLDAVGSSFGLAYKSITPLIWWEVDVASELVEWIKQQGGFSTDGKRIWDAEDYPTFKVPREGQDCRTSAAAFEQMKAVWSYLDSIRKDQLFLKDDILSRINPFLEALSMQFERIEQSQTAFMKDMGEKIGKEFVEFYNSKANERGHWHTKTTEMENTELKSNSAQCKKSPSLCVLSDDTLTKIVNAKPGVANNHQAEKENIMNEDCATSDCSVSPGGPPKEKKKHERAQMPKPIHMMRALFKTRVRTSSNKVDVPRGKFTKRKRGETIHAGPFSVHIDTPITNVRLLDFIFWDTTSKDGTPKDDPFHSVTVASHGGLSVTRTDLQSLGPRQLVMNWVINMFVTYLNEPGNEDWYFTTFFGSNMIPKNDKMSRDAHVKLIRSVCSLNTFEGRLSECRRMMMLDCVFVDEIPTKFGASPFKMDSFGLKQRNSEDCGMILIRNMQRYGTDWAAQKQYDSEAEGANLVLECLLHQKNEVFDLLDTMNQALALWRGSLHKKHTNQGPTAEKNRKVELINVSE